MTVRLAGFWVTVGALWTVRVAAVVVPVPSELEKTARNWYPSWEPVAAKERVVEVAPARSEKVAPPLVLCCHWTVGVGLPDAAAVNCAVAPALTETFAGFWVIAGPIAAAVLVREKVTEMLVTLFMAYTE